ncbi:pkb-activating kinase-like protein [Mortierella sp. AM989]|nr:pkb-activating kinase-like protein [Mortierella sp. AM989]
MSAPLLLPDPPQDPTSSPLSEISDLVAPSTPGAIASAMTSTTPPTPVPTPAAISPSSAPLVSAAVTTSTTTTTTSNTNASATTDSSATHPNSSVPPSTAAIPVRRRTLADYKLGRTLGEGSYSTVVAAIDLSNKRDYAIKVLDKRHIIREKKVKYVNIEKNTLYKLDHPGVVKLYSTFQDTSSLYYVLELCQNGELLTFIKKLGSFDENCTRFYAAQILTAVEYVHNQGVIHRDLKPENILLDNRMYIKLTDFGTAKMLEPSEDGTESDRANSFVGTAEYVSPELLTEKAACKSSDLWALGCIIYQLLAGRPPFKGSNEYQTFQKIVKLEFSFPAGFPKAAMDLVSRLLVHDPNERLGANNTIEKLKQHPFFEGIEWTDLWNQPAPKLMPYLPPTPAHNTEPLRSDHDACLWDVNRAGETLMAVDPFRELGDSASSVGNSERNSMNDSDEVLHKSAGALEATRPSAITSIAATGPTHGISTATSAEAITATTSRSLPELSDATKDMSQSTTNPNAKASLSPPPLQGAIPKSTSASAVIDSSAKVSSVANGHTKAKSSSSKNAFVALFSPSPKNSSSKKLLGKKSKHDQAEDPRKDRTGNADISRENSSVSLAVTASEISAYSRKTQLDLQSELSPWQSFLLPTELVIFQTPVLKRKGLFSRSCILVLTDFPRLLYFDDSNHYFSQLFYSNTNEAYSNWQQQQRVIQWEQLEKQQGQYSLQQQLGGLTLDSAQHLQPHRLYFHPSLSQESQNHQQQQLNALHQPLHQHSPHPRRSTGGKDLPPTTGSGFLLARNGSSKQRHQQTRSEHIPGQIMLEQAEEIIITPTRSARASIEHGPHQHQHPHSTHNRQQSNGHNKIDVEKPPHVVGTTSSSATSSLTNSVLSASALAGNTFVPGSKSNTTLAATGSGQVTPSGSSDYATGVKGGSINGSNKGSSVVPPVSPAMIKASKKQAKLRGEILFTASVVSEVKGKKCFFIHTTKKSYYFEENREGDAKLWIRVLERCMEEWFGELSGAVEATNVIDKIAA